MDMYGIYENQLKAYYGYVKSGNFKNPKQIPKKKTPSDDDFIFISVPDDRQQQHLAIKSKSEKCHTVAADAVATKNQTKAKEKDVEKT